MSEKKFLKPTFRIDLSLLTLALILLKVTDTISISWFWVFSPLWLPWAIILAVCVIVFIAAFITAAINIYNTRR